ncbi:MAG: glucosyltransferase [Candidatus Paceibacter sp.]|jgi:glycosyltransferase involved in cell wall biosynthesis|nr:glucosyltransferase [Candidatus Paceibacter sp.]
MRILIATGIFKPEMGGPATIAGELAKRLHATGHKVTVLTYSDKPRYDFDGELNFRLIRIVRAERKIVNYLRFFFTAFQEIKKHDVIYSLDWFSVGVPLMLAAKLRGKKYLVRVGGGYIWEKYLAEGKPPMSLRDFYARGLHKTYRLMYFSIKKVLANAERVVFNSDIQRELYIHHYDLVPEKTLTIHNAIPENRISGLVQSYNDRNFRRDKEIVFAGRFIKMKNIESLISAFSILNDQQFTLLLVGGGPLENTLRQHVKDLGLTDRVLFLPPMTQSELYYRISNCYMVVIPSWTDVSPNQAYECLALGIPFLITRENYLNIAPQIPLSVNPGSVDDIAEKLNLLLDEKNYVDYVKKLQAIDFHHPWDLFVQEHVNVFMNITK